MLTEWIFTWYDKFQLKEYAKKSNTCYKMSLDDIMNGLCMLLTLTKNYMFIPGKIEQFLVLIETNEMNLFRFPFKVKT